VILNLLRFHWILFCPKKHGTDLAARIEMSKAVKEVKLLDPKGILYGCGVVDKDGNSVSLIQSIYHDLGQEL